MLNTGEMEEIESITTSISSLISHGNVNAAAAFKHLTEALVAEKQLTGSARADAIENLQELAAQAALPAPERAKPSTIRALLTAVGTTLSTSANLAEIWGTWGPHIRLLFGL